MRLPCLAVIALGGTVVFSATATWAQEHDTEDMVAAVTELFGHHKGYRAVHAKGFCGEGSFQATPAAAAISEASVFGGEQVLSAAEKAAGDDFRQTELAERLVGAAMDYDVYLQFPEEGDPLDDAFIAWPADREKVHVGRLALASVDAVGEAGRPCDQEMFDPTGLPDGIEPSDDPVLLIRAEAYAVSFSRRLSD